MEKRKREPRPKLYEEEVVHIGRVTKVTKGGRHFRFSAVVVVGDRKGKIGLGTGKANEVQDAIKKAIGNATNNMIKIDLVEDRTVSHDAIGSSGAIKRLFFSSHSFKSNFNCHFFTSFKINFIIYYLPRKGILNFPPFFPGFVISANCFIIFSFLCFPFLFFTLIF